MLKTILLFITININLLAYENIITQYRINGYLKNFEQKADKYLFSDEYADSLLRNKDVKFGYFEENKYLIVVNKKKKIFALYTYKNGKLTLQKVFYHIFTGQKEGDKQREGDKKTPIGAYNILRMATDKYLDEIYGALAYVTSYPNAYDKYLGKSGSNIWIHGVPRNTKRNPYTQGCVALKNENLMEVRKIIKNYKKAIVFINNKYRDTNKKELKAIIKQLFLWRYYWKYNNVEKYLSFYDKKKFEKIDTKLKFPEFGEYKRNVFSRKEHKIIGFQNLTIIPYPNPKHEKIFKVTFWENYKTNHIEFHGQKIVYLRLDGNKIKILMEN